MRAALIRAINDFPTYGMVFGWSTYGKLAYPYYMENNKAFTQTNRGKTFFLLPTDHRYRKNIFWLIQLKRMLHPHIFLVKNYDVVSEYGDIVFSFQFVKQKFPGVGLTHNQVKRSSFKELPHWKTNLLHHNLDIIHMEKNMYENIFNTVMDVKGKIKNIIKARMDITLFYNRKNMELAFDRSQVTKTRASFTLEKNAQLLVYQQLMCFRDGHA